MAERIISGWRAFGRMRTCCASGGAALTVIILLVMYRSPPAPEPVYAGKTVTQWLDGGYEPAAMALEELGPSAVPWVFKTLRRDQPSFDYVAAFTTIRRYAPTLLVSMLPRQRPTGFDELRAANLLIGMGPPVLPALTAGLQDSNAAVRTACQMALRALGPKRGGAPQRSR
jgi:hypothetical protein